MSYQVLARKYRPQQFADVIGQEHVTQTLKNALESGRIHHAYLFTGARGIGKTTVARLLAKALNCELGKEEPCGECSPCQEITAGTSLDVQEIDGASNTSVDDVREIRERVKFLPTAGKYKIYIIDEVHMLSTSAFNALLKTLEEPPAHVIFIFATTEAHKIPATILSRCQRYDFRRISVKRVSQTLQEIATQEKVIASSDALALIAKESGGSMRDAQSLFDQAIAFADGEVNVETLKNMLGFLDRKQLFDLLGAVLERDAKRALDCLDLVFEQGADLVRFSADMLECFRHLLVLQVCGDEKVLVDLPAHEVSQLKTFAEKLTAEELQLMFQSWYRGSDEVARSSMPKMLLEVLLLRLCRIESVRPVGELMQKVEQLMSGVAAPISAAAITQPAAPQKPAATTPLAASPSKNPQEQWQDFKRWIAVESPRVASLLQHGDFVALQKNIIEMKFNNPLYADMLSEPDRKAQVGNLFTTFFKRELQLDIKCENSGGESDSAIRVKEVKQLTKEALNSDMVREAAELLGAQIHDVKTVK